MALDQDPFEDDPIAEAEIVPREWRRQARAANASLRRARQTQNARLRQGLPPMPMGNLDELAAIGAGQQAGGGGGDVGGGDLARGIQELCEQARAIRQLLEEIKSGLPLVGAYGP